MADDPLFTLKQLADQLGLPESTVRYYRDAFLDHIPSVGTGRRRRYPTQAIAVLRTIARHYAAGQSRSEIVHALGDEDGARSNAVQAPDARSRSRELDDVSNLDLLAAILDGEREQRDALWQMAKEIVRLTEVMEGQDKVLTEIADKAGVAISGHTPLPMAAPAPRLSAPSAPAAAPAPAAPAAPAAPPPGTEPATIGEATPAPAPPPATQLFAPPASPFAEPPAMPWAAPLAPMAEPREAPAAPAARATPSGAEDMDRLRAELESERELVERLRESKLQLEHRVADAEATLEDRRKGRPSVIRRLLGSDEPR